MRVYILDTGGKELDKILIWLSESKGVKEVLVFKKAVEFLEQVQKQKPELVLVWLSATDLSGLNIGRSIKSIHSKIKLVFISEQKDYAIDAYDIGAYGYFLQPVEKKRFDKMLLIIRESIHSDSFKDYIDKRRK